jgi:2-hydroxy-6-oxonona-2,4-dienedioate hydrolase
MALTPEQELARVESLAEVRKTPSGGGSMVWRVWGKGQPLVLLHGTFGSWRHWVRNVEALSKHFRVMAADMPGFGDSDLPATPTSVVSLVETIAAGIDQLTAADEPVNYGGFSYGASMSSPTALRTKRKTGTVCMLGSHGLGGKRADPGPLVNWREAKTPEELRQAQIANVGTLLIYDKAKIDDLAIHIQTVNTMKARFRTRLTKDRDQLNGSVERIDARMASIWGDHDATAYPYIDEQVQKLRKARPDCKITVIANAGHWVGYEAPDQVNALMLDALGAAATA